MYVVYTCEIPCSSLLIRQDLNNLFAPAAVAPFLRSVSARRKVCVVIAVPATRCTIWWRLEPIYAEVVVVVVVR